LSCGRRLFKQSAVSAQHTSGFVPGFVEIRIFDIHP